MSHTPGPWQAAEKPECDGDMVSAGDEAICHGPLDVYHNMDRVKANARLIAAAPELLAACRRALAELNGTKEKCDGPLSTIVILTEAINLAEGKE